MVTAYTKASSNKYPKERTTGMGFLQKDTLKKSTPVTQKNSSPHSKTSLPSSNIKKSDDKTILDTIRVSHKNNSEKPVPYQKKTGQKRQVKVISVTPLTEELEPIEIIVDNQNEVKEDEQPIVMSVQENPSFQGGDLQNFQKYILQNFKIPKSLKETRLSGKIVAQFAVDTNGKVGNIRIIHGLNPTIDNEMIRVLENSPAWKPAQQGGRTIFQQYILPLTVDLKEEL